MKKEYTSPDLAFLTFSMRDILVQSTEESTIVVETVEATLPPIDDDWLTGG